MPGFLTMSWVPDGRRLRHLREQQEYTIELLADAAGVGEKTIRNLESGRTRKARLTTLKALCAVLDIDVSDIAAPGGHGPDAESVRSVPLSLPAPQASQQPPGPQWGPTRLEQLVERELQGGRPPPLSTVDGPVLMLTPKKFQDIITAFLLHEGRRLWQPALVLRQRGISEAEARRLQTECGIGARFLLSQRAELTGGEPFHVTAYTVRPEHTRALQERLEARTEVALLLRVVVARPDPQTLADGRPRFQGFPMYGSQTLHPWSLVVEEVLERQGGDKETTT